MMESRNLCTRFGLCDKIILRKSCCTTRHPSSHSEKAGGEKIGNIPVGTLKIGLLGSDDQTAKDDIAMSIGGVVKASRNQKSAL